MDTDKKWLYTTDKLIKRLKTLPKNTKVYCSSDEEGNSIMKGINIELWDKDSICLFPLSGTELEEDY